MSVSSWAPRLQGLCAAAITGGVILVAHLLRSAEHGPVLCLFRLATSLPCPSCGMTRAFVALAHGDLTSATALNVASPAVFGATHLILLLGLAQSLHARPLLTPVWRYLRRPIAVATVLVMTAAWILNLVQHRL